MIIFNKPILSYSSFLILILIILQEQKTQVERNGRKIQDPAGDI